MVVVPEPNKSEVARLLGQIQQEYEASRSGLTGLAATARHRFITTRQENIAKLHEELQKLVGDDRAMGLIVMKLEQADYEGGNECKTS